MTQGQRYLLAVCCLLMSMPAVHAQSNAKRPGHVSRGRFIGFAPKHERLRQARSSLAVAKPKAFAATEDTNPFDNPIQVSADESQVIAFDQGVRTAGHGEPVVTQAFAQQATLGGAAAEIAQCSCSACCAPALNAASCNTCSTQSACQPSLWFGGEYLYWSTNGVDAPSLVTTSTTGTERNIAGVLEEDGVSTLFGSDEFHSSGRSGNRFHGGMLLSPGMGFEVTYTSLDEDSETFSATQNDFGILARPFFNTQLIEEDSRLINFPDLVEGSLSVRATSEFDSLEIMMLRGGAGATKFTLGYRSANLDEIIRFDETTTSLVSPTLDSTFVLFDEFDVENRFNGGQFGVHYVGNFDSCWSFDVIGKASLGSTRSRVRISGSTTTTTGTGDVSTATGGLLAQSSNIGTTSDSEFGALFEVGVKLRRRFQSGLHFTVGYTFLHWGDVARAVEQIDSSLNPTQISPDTLVGPPRPLVMLDRGNFWAQGLNVGLEYQF